MKTPKEKIEAARKKLDNAIAELVQTIAREGEGSVQNAIPVGWVLSVDHKFYDGDLGFMGGLVSSYHKPEQNHYHGKMILERAYEAALEHDSPSYECDRVHVDEVDDDG
ncbi:hypothetical protein L3Y19_gp113 [Gordonia phage Neville]|uniref:Uncharacterized protein n=2 Tax=Nevillevirus TaxID=3044773 RepID=A0A515MH52_9CAUD|nr:hypothetical protein L3Y19_gp113 [Gordonia phage Neville]YP_010246096.1 hypothetical protein L3Y20_gp114 [Gordonia phage Trax]AXQ64474.1 hypothetical protein SEA_NEVILLE_117 [Gordonia phage Neville]QDM55998.1 hypothetical protein SEA_TRAX_118 [Gordonia phage Trax]